MWNPFNRKKKQTRALRQTAYAFGIVGEFNRRGLLHWQVKEKALLIEECLAVVELAKGKDGFTHFLNHVVQWQNFRLIRDAYERQRIDTEVAAVHAAQKPGVALTRADIQRIRQYARETMVEIDPATLGMIQEFDIYIIRAEAQSAKKAKSAGMLVAVGHYDGEKLEMAMYDEIRNALFDNKGKEEK